MSKEQIQVVNTGYNPRPHQRYLHKHFKRFNVVCAHRRFGKTVTVINEMIDRGLRNDLKNPRYYYIAPTYSAAKRIAWDYLKDFTKNIPNFSSNEQELRVDIYRPDKDDTVRFTLLGSENPSAVRGVYADGVIVDEYAECDPTIWSLIIRPALSDRLGWAIFIGTPKGRNHFYDIYHKTLGLDDWFHAMFKVSETKIIPDSELEAARHTMTEEEYEQEYEVSFNAALIGSYYNKYLSNLDKEGKLYATVPYDPALPVITAWDLGIGDSTAIWFYQVYLNEIRLIKYFEDSGKGLEHYANEIKSTRWVFERHDLPHDAAAKDLSTGITRQQTLENLLGAGTTRIVARQSVDDGIHAVRMLLPRCVFDAKGTKQGVECLLNYQKGYDSKNKVFKNTPQHDWSSHGADGFRTLALGFQDPSKKILRKNLPRQAETEYNIYGR